MKLDPGEKPNAATSVASCKGAASSPNAARKYRVGGITHDLYLYLYLYLYLSFEPRFLRTRRGGESCNWLEIVGNE
jgi:hypothetical protein